MRMSAEDDDAFPQSMRHRKVLDVAEDHPDASIDEIASMVPSATADLVEHVFDQHGDPAAEDAEASAADGGGSTDDGHEDSAVSAEPATASAEADEAAESAAESVPHPDADGSPGVPLADLSDRQRELLEVVAARPDATQGEVADHFDVTRATVSRWASDIEGFDWRDRADVVPESVAATAAPLSTDGGATAETAGSGSEQEAQTPDAGDERLEDRLDALESRVAEFESAREGDVDVDLAHKIAHACLHSEAISEDEELRILEWLLG